jgi:carotenoid cleavage dioxygenase
MLSLRGAETENRETRPTHGEDAMAVFPNTPMFAGVNAPSRLELDLYDLEVVGEIPRGMEGAFYRVAADHQFPPRFVNDVPFNADGIISMFRFEGGRVDLKTRYVRTERWKAERAAGGALYGRYRNRFTDDPSVQGKSRNLANTSIISFDGVMLALREDSPPVALDPVTLETISDWDFHGTLPGPTFTAHPRRDPDTGELIAYGYAAKGDFSRDVVAYEIGADGRVEHAVWFELPYFCMLHDFAVTKDYLVWPVIPQVGAGEDGLKRGLPYYGWDPSKEIYLGVLPRRGRAEDMRWFKAPNQFTSHVMNAWNEGTKIRFDTCRSSGNLFPFFPEFGKPFDPSGMDVKLTRWTVDMASDSDAFESTITLSDFIGEFPETDERVQMKPYRHGWLLGFGPGRNSLGHVDLKTGRTESWTAAPDTPVQEPCFVPRSAAAPEGDGWILQAATDGRTGLTEVNVFEATDVARGPIATIKTPVHLKPAYHGSWADSSLIKPSGLV